MGQCTSALQEEVNWDPDYISKTTDFDSIWLLQTLQKITVGVNKATNKYFSTFKSMKIFYLTQQSFHESMDEYYTRFDTAKDLVQLFDADIVDTTSLLKNELVTDKDAWVSIH